MPDDTRPKFIHYFSKTLIEPRSTATPTGAYISSGDLMFIQSILFEVCGIIGRFCTDQPEPFFRTLITREGLEEKAIAGAQLMFDKSVRPFCDESFGSLDLVFRNICSAIHFEGGMEAYLSTHGQEVLPVEQMKPAIIAWGVAGGFTGLRHPEIIHKLINWTYGTSEERGFASEEAEMMENAIGENPLSTREVEKQAVELFSSFCKEFYPLEAKEFSFS